MRRGAVALVHGEPVPRMVRLHRHHQSVPADLGQHAGRRDACGRRVAADHRQRRHRQPRHPEPVAEHIAGSHRQPRHRPTHPLDVGHVHAAPVDLGRRDEHHVVGQRVPADQRKQLLPRRFRQLLRIIKGSKAFQSIWPEHARRDHQRPGTRPAPDLVHAGHRPEPAAVQRGLQGAQPATPDLRITVRGGQVVAMPNDSAADSPIAQHPNARAARQ